MKLSGIWRTRRVRCGIQALSLGLFLWLLWHAVSPLPVTIVPVDLFLRLDPLVAVGVPLATREWLPSLWPGFVVLLATLVFGRIFCGYVCPMGATLDVARAVLRKVLGGGCGGNASVDRLERLRHVKYLALAAMLGAALVGVNTLFWGAPIPLITRFYTLLIHPLALLAGHTALDAGQPLVAALDIPALTYAQIPLRRFDTLYALLAFFGLLFWLERRRPRFWCRYLCPAGALLGLCSRRPLWRRRVHTCAHCGQCFRQCPAGAILPAATSTEHAECITCRTCVNVCPSRGTVFGPRVLPLMEKNQPAQLPKTVPMLPSRRAFLAGTGAGVALAAVELSGTHNLLVAQSKGAVWSELCIRPPGAVPEAEFLDRCMRCGQCMKVCPSNGLQPSWFAAGPEGVFSPVLLARRGACEPNCNACGQVCPTQAVRALPLEEKHWAKIGTAVVQPGRCLAWTQGQRCVVCQEVCPYGAIESVQTPGAVVPVPVVKASRCFGCGYCELHCPVRVPAIVLEPLNALRLNTSEYKAAGMAAGLHLLPGNKGQEQQDASEALPEGTLPPGFTE